MFLSVQVSESKLGLYLWKKVKISFFLLVYNNSILHTFETQNVENVESHNYQHFFKFENVEEFVY